MPTPRKVTAEHEQLFIDVFRARQQLPSNKELARAAGVSPETVHNYMREFSAANRFPGSNPGHVGPEHVKLVVASTRNS